MLDIIVVNDGSTDNSVEIAQKYVNKYPDVYRILNKEMVVMARQLMKE